MAANRITLETGRVKVTIEFDELDPKVGKVIESLAALLDLPDPAMDDGEIDDEDPSEDLADYEDDEDDGLRDEARAAAGDREFLRRGAR